MAMDEMTDEEYEQALQDAQNNMGRIGFGEGDKFLGDEVNYTKFIITDEVKEDIKAILENMFLTKSTVSKIITYLTMGSTYETVINNYSTSDVQREKIGFRSVRIWLDNTLSGLEAKYNDAALILKAIEVHHRTKVLRSANGFERKTQKENIISSKSGVMRSESRPEPKTGISRITGNQRF